MAAVLIGCGGGGGGGGSKSPTTGTTSTTSGVPGAGPGDSIAMVGLPTATNSSGRVNVAYLPLQGRALETFTAIIRQIELGTGSDIFVEPLASPISFVLNGSEVQQRSASVPVPNGVGRTFTTFYLNIDTLIDDPSPGVPPDDDRVSQGDPDNPFVQEQAAPANIRILPSRETTVPVLLNDAMISFDDQTSEFSFLPDQFLSANHPPIQGFISDFLEFDVSTMGAKRPTMSTGQQADRVYFSGDRFALSAQGPKGYFEMLTSDVNAPKTGEFQDPVLIGNTPTPGVYRTVVPDPTDPSPTPRSITELFGIFRQAIDPNRPNNNAILNAGNFEVILMPRSGGDDDQQILLVAFNGSKATNLYWGDARLSAGTFVAFPLQNLVSGSAAGAIQGTLTGFLNKTGTPVTINSPSAAGSVYYGRYAITGIIPTGFRPSGRFIVYRR